MRHILVVDDEPQNREILSDFLKLKGFDVTTAHHGREAIKLFSENHYDAAIIDLRMPVLDGIDCASELNKIDNTFPIIFITGFLNSTFKERLKGIQYQYLLTKPVEILEIEQKLKSLFEK